MAKRQTTTPPPELLAEPVTGSAAEAAPGAVPDLSGKPRRRRPKSPFLIQSKGDDGQFRDCQVSPFDDTGAAERHAKASFAEGSYRVIAVTSEFDVQHTTKTVVTAKLVKH